MPLRPVSELGLVDVTDLGSRFGGDTTTTRPSQRRERRSGARSDRTGPERDLQGGRPAAQSEHDRPSTPSRSEGRDAPSAASDDSRYDETKRSFVVDTGLSLVGGAIGVGGGLLLARRVLER